MNGNMDQLKIKQRLIFSAVDQWRESPGLLFLLCIEKMISKIVVIVGVMRSGGLS
jgi:hypothetical protein